MPFVLLVLGSVFLVTGVRGTQDEFLTQFRQDMLGDKGFVFFIVSILAIGALGYVPQARSLSVAFMTLVFVVLIVSNGNVFDRIYQQIKEA